MEKLYQIYLKISFRNKDSMVRSTKIINQCLFGFIYLSYFQGQDREGSQDQCHDAETEDDLGLVVQVGAAFEDDGTGGVILEYLLHTRAEMVMQGCAFPYAHMASTGFVVFIDLRLHDDGDAFHEEDTAKQGDEEFFMNDHGAYTDDTAYGEATGVAEEDLRWEAVEPEVTDEGTDEGRHEDHQFFGAGYVHHIEILRPNDTTGGVGEDEEGDAYYRGVSGTHTVHTVVKVRTIADRGYNEDGKQHEEDPPEAVLVGLTGPAEQIGIVEVMMLDEGDSGLRRFDLGCFFHHHDIILDMGGNHFVHADRWAETEGESDDEAERHLSGYLNPSVESVFILAEGLDIIIREAERTHEEGGDEHENHIDIGQFAQQ